MILAVVLQWIDNIQQQLTANDEMGSGFELQTSGQLLVAT